MYYFAKIAKFHLSYSMIKPHLITSGAIKKVPTQGHFTKTT